MSVTDKFKKRITLIPGRSTYSVEDWADALLDRLDIADWGYPKLIITDRDRKFLSELWKRLFKRLGVSLLYSTAYHSQTDGASERTNQTAEIALRFHISTIESPSEWPKVLSSIQASNNNSVSSATKRAWRRGNCSDSGVVEAFIARSMGYKYQYDRLHQLLFLRVNDLVLLRLHKGYTIPSTVGITTKLAQQFVGPFE